MSPQFNIPLGPIAGLPGMAFDSEASNRDVTSRICSVNIPFGVYCELDANGLLIPLADSTTGAGFAPSAWGIAMFVPLATEEQYVPFAVPNVGAGSTATGWLKGQSVAVMRKGRLWVQTDGAGTIKRTGPINVNHSSDGTHPQGVFTFSGVSSTPGHEIDIAPSVSVYNPDLTGGALVDVFNNTFNTIVVEVNL